MRETFVTLGLVRLGTAPYRKQVWPGVDNLSLFVCRKRVPLNSAS